MQFLESSVIGLRSARHRLDGPGGGSVTLYPMVHIGDSAFYAQVRSEADAHDFVLYEGVSSPVARRLTSVYRWTDTRRLDLAVQSKDMFGDMGSRAILADLEPSEFEALWRESPWPWRAAAQVAFPLAGIWRRFTATRAGIARAHCETDLPTREALLMWNRHSAPFLNALLTARDVRICSVLTHLLAGNGRGARIAVVYGAAHMQAVVHALAPAGFVPAESRWLNVIAL